MRCPSSQDRIEQLRIQFAFEPAERLTARGLHEVQPLGGPAEVRSLRHGADVAQLTRLHGPSVRRDQH